MTQKGLILTNAAWNTLFVLMALSEMTTLTSVHDSLPPSLKWWWLIALAGGNLVIHLFMALKAGEDEDTRNAIRSENYTLRDALREANNELVRRRHTVVTQARAVSHLQNLIDQ